MLIDKVRVIVVSGAIASLFLPSIGVAEEQSAEDGIRANLARIAEAINSKDLDKYGDNVTSDLVNMTASLQGEASSSVGSQARIDELRAFFETSPYTRHAAMDPLEILVDGDRAFALVKGTLSFTPKQGTELDEYTLTVDLHLFFRRVEEHGWQTERSMAIVRECSAPGGEAVCIYHAGGQRRGGAAPRR